MDVVKELGLITCERGEFGQGGRSSVGGDAGYVCLGADMEGEVQDRAQVEVEREEQGVGETHGKEQGEEQRVKEKTLKRTTWMTMSMG